MNGADDWLLDAPPGQGPDAMPLLILAHGAGAGRGSVFMENVAQRLSDRGIAVARFNFEYMTRSEREGRRIAPPRVERLMAEYRARVAHWTERGLRPFIGGKSMGGRVASMLADELFAAGMVRGLVCLGYPFHPPGRPQNLRIAHLRDAHMPALICQGDRDPFGRREEVEGYALPGSIRFCWLPDGDHDFKPRVKSGETWAGNLDMAAGCIAEFILRTGGAYDA